ncbi:MAG: pyridoxal phosphate-dependent aminotransferase [Halanaerobiales bacterium]|nr:pyridoxal phosphate-dependent aminotransferase [Halanaerobiales bacterium]
MELSRKHLSISKSLTLAISAKAKEMKADGLDVIGFGVGEPDFPTPSFIIAAAKEALDSGKTRYTAAAGIKELREAVCRKLKSDHGLDYRQEEIIISNGAKHSLYNAFQAILNPGDQVIIQSPYWVSYPELVKMGGGKPVFVEASEQNDLKMKMADLEKAITASTKAILINSPSNPNGSVYNRAELERIAELAVEHDLYLVSDEVYEKLVYDGLEHISLASLGKEVQDRTILVNGVSKTFAMTGWRIGYAAGPEAVISVMSNLQSHATSNPNSIAQYASVAALTHPASDETVAKMVEQFAKRRDYMVEQLNLMAGLSCLKPGGAFYVMLNIQDLLAKKYQGQRIDGSIDFANLLLKAEKVAVVPGIAFGADHLIRLSYATSMDNIEKGLKRIESFVKEIV